MKNLLWAPLVLALSALGCNSAEMSDIKKSNNLQERESGDQAPVSADEATIGSVDDYGHKPEVVTDESNSIPSTPIVTPAAEEEKPVLLGNPTDEKPPGSTMPGGTPDGGLPPPPPPSGKAECDKVAAADTHTIITAAGILTYNITKSIKLSVIAAGTKIQINVKGNVDQICVEAISSANQIKVNVGDYKVNAISYAGIGSGDLFEVTVPEDGYVYGFEFANIGALSTIRVKGDGTYTCSAANAKVIGSLATVDCQK